MGKEYIEDRDGSYYIAGTRISLDSIVHAFLRGEPPETICQNFELLRLEEVYGADRALSCKPSRHRCLSDSPK